MHASSDLASPSPGSLSSQRTSIYFPGMAPSHVHRYAHKAGRWAFEQQIVLSVVAILPSFSSSICVASCRTRFPLAGSASIRQDAGRLGAALLPLNRGLIFALVPIAIIESLLEAPLDLTPTWAAFFALILLAAIAAKVLDPRLYDDRVSSPDNVYQRVAQHRETLHVVREYPLFGVGFGLYHDVAAHNPRYMVKWNGIESMNYPHNALMTVLSEEGIFGLMFYVRSQVISDSSDVEDSQGLPTRLAGIPLLLFSSTC